MNMARVKQAGAVAWLIGIAVFIGLTVWSGPYAVGDAVASVGWGLLLVVPVRAVTVVAAGTGWWLLFPPKMRPRLRTCVVLRFIREGGNVLLMQVGGDLIGARLLTLRGVAGPLAGASVIVDVLIQAATQYSGVNRAVVRSVVDHLTDRTDQLKLTATPDRANDYVANLGSLVTALAMNELYTGRLFDTE